MEYKRLTERMEDGTPDPNCSECEHYKACGDEHYCDDEQSCYQKIVAKLCELEDKIEQGTLIELPCKVGDTVYHYSRIFGAIFPYFVESLNIGCIGKDQTYWNYEANYHNEETDELIDEIDFCPDDIGETVFLTREEAEKRLKELQNG